MAAKAMALLMFWRRNLNSFNERSFMIIFPILIRPHLEYCAPVWIPYMVRDVNALERVQRKATKLIPHLSQS
ncbi:hypothetical protein ACN6QZ_19345, partial [Acinetobacter baumannii]